MRRVSSFEGLTFTDTLRARLYGPALRSAWHDAQHKERAYVEILRRAWADDPADTAAALMLLTWLPGFGLLAVVKVTMAHSLEARVPYFDPPLLDFALSVPPAIRLRENKVVLREALRDDLPDFALRRPKQPFGTPILRWFDTALADRVQAVLLDEDGVWRAAVRPGGLEGVLRGHFSGRTERVEVVFRLLLLELWQQATTTLPHIQPDANRIEVRV